MKHIITDCITLQVAPAPGQEDHNWQAGSCF